MKKKLMFVLLFLPLLSKSQVITTYAGGGSSGLCEGCLATESVISDPGGSVFDSLGNLYFASGLGHRVRKVNSSGVITTIAGTGSSGYTGDGGLAIAAKVNVADAVKLDTFGNIYIADFNNFRIRKINASTGIISTFAGIGIMGYNGDGIPAITAEFAPTDILIDNMNNVYIADYNGRRVRKIDASGVIHTIAGIGTVGYSGDGGLATAAQLNPSGLAMDDMGNIYISDPYANVVRKINTAGIISTVAGNGSWIYAGDGIPATDAQIQPTGIAIDKFNNLYISDNFNKRVFRVNPAGVIHCIAGNGVAGYSGDGGLATAASMDLLSQLSTDRCGNLYVSEASGRIRKVTFTMGGAPPPTVTIAVSPNDTVCAGVAATFTATIAGGTGGYTYTWLKDGIAFGGGNPFTYTPSAGDTISCIIADEEDVCNPGATSNYIAMVTTSLAVPGISITGTTSAAIGSTVTVNATVVGAGSAYNIKWYKNTVLFNTTTVPMVTYTKTVGTDIITAKVISATTGCYDSTTSAPHTVTGSSVNVLQQQYAVGDFALYPNPVKTNVTLSASYEIHSVSITNTIGQSFDNLPMLQSKYGVQIDVAQLPAGVYVVRVNDIYFMKFVKE